MITTLDLIRHGEPVGGSRYRGQTDDPLSEVGWQQMRRAVGDDCPWEVIVSSPLCRCQSFAQELAHRHGRLLELEPRLVEIGLGAWEGLTKEEINARNPGSVRRFWEDPLNFTPAGGEGMVNFQQRVLGAWQEIVARHQGRHILIVAHAGVIRILIAHALDMPLARIYRLIVPNAGLSRIKVTPTGPELLFHAAAHL